MTDTELEKRNAAKASLEYIENNTVIGLGTGSTAAFMVRYLGERVASGFSIKGVPSSKRTAELARAYNITLTSLAEVKELDLYIDGADEIDPDFNMIKGGGGALLREKILAHNSKKTLIIVDYSKQVKKLGAFKLPIEAIPFAYKSVMLELSRLGLNPVLRLQENQPFMTDENNCIIDVEMQKSDRYDLLNNALLNIPGVVETGLFLNYVDTLIVGKKKGVETFKNSRKRN